MVNWILPGNARAWYRLTGKHSDLSAGTGRYEVKRRFRLTRSTDYKRVRRLGKSYAHPLIVLIALPNDTGEMRIGVTASHMIGNAVQRNRVRRRLKACFDEFIPGMRCGWDLVAIARRPIVDATYSDIRSGLARMIEQAGLMVER